MALAAVAHQQAAVARLQEARVLSEPLAAEVDGARPLARRQVPERDGAVERHRDQLSGAAREDQVVDDLLVLLEDVLRGGRVE